MPEFVHLHCHTQYSLLDGACEIGTMMKKAAEDGQKAVALTDHGNMFGAFKFVAEAQKAGVKPIIGCEFYMVEDRHRKSFSKAKGERDSRFHQLLLAKNRKGYENLCKLCSLGFIEGLYSKFPRIDKELITQYHEGLIATSCCIGAEIPQAILHQGIEKAEELLKWWIDLFGDDFYIELQRHRGLENIDNLGISQEDINQQLIQLARKYNLKLIATNDAHYVDEDDALPHDLLLCINTNSLVEEKDRFKFPSKDFYFKTQKEMNVLFHDVPESIDNTLEIYDKIEALSLEREVLLPNFPIPEGFAGQDDYLRHLTFEGAKWRYGTITPTIEERLNFELEVIRNSGYPGYFLIVQDFTNTAKEMGVAVGPGRGSAAGSAVAYCIGITNVDPIKYDLLFERFLNPERISMPDIDIDFDDEGRQKVLDYVIEKYGRNQVAQIVTYGSMAAKSSLRDVGRVMNIPLSSVDKIAKAFPTNLGATLNKVLAQGDIQPKLKGKMNSEDVEKAYQFRKLAEGKDETAKMIQLAKQLEGSIRNTGIHACGVIITPDDITKYIPVKTDKGADMLVSQFDNSVAEDAGLLKMDFLGLKTLTIIRDAVRLVKAVRNIEIDLEALSLEDTETYELFQRGETIGIFQYESSGMQKYLKELKPTSFEDIIAMNALYRPGPLEYIPEFIERKHGRKPVIYDLDDMEEYLKETYGICVYQEQVMLLSQKLAGFSKGEADTLRKAMGKKKKALVDKMWPKFLEGCKKNGYPEETIKKIWTDWEAFASYAFNKSHSTCYALVAFQTAYLKAHYPAEFMAAVLTHNKSDISKVNFFLQECKRMGIQVLGPDINESQLNFTVNEEGQIRFGLSALKGVGEGPVEEILKERGHSRYQSPIDFISRLPSKAANKKVVESLVLGGAFDCFETYHRAQYFGKPDFAKDETYIEALIRFGSKIQVKETAPTLFDVAKETDALEPTVPEVQPWPLIDLLTKEKAVTGIYISGHPLDDYRMEVKYFTTCPLDKAELYKGRPLKLAGLVTSANHRISKRGTGYGYFTIQDYTGSLELTLFSEDYQNFKNLLEEGQGVFLQGIFQKRWKDNDFQFKLTKVEMLESVAEKMTASITLKLPIEKITEKVVNDIETICNDYKGKHKFKIQLLDREKREKMDLYSKSRNIKVSNALLHSLDELGIEYHVGCVQ